MPAYVEDAQRWQAEFGVRVRELRASAGLGQMRLAEVAGLHPTYVSSLERGQRNASLVNIHKIARALSVQPAQLLDG